MIIFDVSSPHFYIAIVLALINAGAMCFLSSKFLQILQLSGYRIKGYNEWLKDTRCKYISRCAMLSFLSISSMIVVNSFMDFYAPHKLYSYIGLIIYFVLTFVFVKHIHESPKKTPLKQTHRMNRLIIVVYILSAIFTYGLFVLFYSFDNIIRFAIIGIVPSFMPLIVLLAHIIILPLELLNKKRYISKAKKELKKHPNLIKIGITGSYGKTSTKYILNKILLKKYKVCMSPNSFNTPMGLTKVILKYLKDDDEVLIAEMGAKQVGEINELCNLINPKYGIITSVGAQHLATFGSIKNIQKTKNELSLNVKDTVVFNKDNELCYELYNNRINNKLCISLNGEADVSAKNIILTTTGLTFDIDFKGESISVTSKLIGEHNITNILLASALAYKLNVSKEQIKEAISELEPIPHRLELKKNNGVTILDNSYNSSVDGTKASLKALSLFEGRKVVVTPGLVELGKSEQQENFELGKRIAEVADIVIIVNEVHKTAITEGLLENNFDKDNIYHANNLTHVIAIFKTLLRDGDIVLFENDLPDNYT